MLIDLETAKITETADLYVSANGVHGFFLIDVGGGFDVEVHTDGEIRHDCLDDWQEFGTARVALYFEGEAVALAPSRALTEWATSRIYSAAQLAVDWDAIEDELKNDF